MQPKTLQILFIFLVFGLGQVIGVYAEEEIVNRPAPGPTNFGHSVAIDEDSGPNPWTHLQLNNNPRNFQFAIISDRTGRVRPGVFADGIQKLNLLQPEFVITIGDVIEGSEKSEQEINEQWDMMLPIINRLEMPFFFIPGNHDFKSKATKDIWKERFGRDYYHFIYQDVLFLCLNGAGPIGDDQIEYFDNVLKKNGVRWTLVFLHKPRWSRQERADWNKF